MSESPATSSGTNQPPQGRIDTHCHLLPGIDDGCKTPTESLECARALVQAGYTHVFCTPHVWPSLLHNRRDVILRALEELRSLFAANNVPLTLLPGGELNLRPGIVDEPDDRIVTYGMANKYVLIDFWADRLPKFFDPVIAFLQARGLTVVLAHPERVNAVQNDPSLAQRFADAGILLQGNLQCFGDPPNNATRKTAELFLRQNRYFMLGSDCHGPDTLPVRLRGLQNARELAGDDTIDRLTKINPGRLIPNR